MNIDGWNGIISVSNVREEMPMNVLKQINDSLGNFDNIIGLIGVITGIIGLFVGGVGIKLIKNNDEDKIDMGKSKNNNSQIANTINNSGINVADAEHIAERITDEKTKNKPDIIFSKEEQKDAPEGTIWMKIDE